MSEPLEPWTNHSWTYTEREHIAYENQLVIDAILDRVRWPIDDDDYERSIDEQASSSSVTSPRPEHGDRKGKAEGDDSQQG